MLPVFGLLLGLLIGYLLIPFNIPATYSNYVAVAILACLDSVFGGVAATLQKKYDNGIFISGFLGNALLAAALAFIGDKLGVDLFLAAVFAFGNRMFLNFAIIRRCILNKWTKKDIIKEKTE